MGWIVARPDLALYSMKPRFDRVFLVPCVFLLVTTLLLNGCDSNTAPVGTTSPETSRNCLPDLKLIDQNGREMSLSSLRGKPVLFDFIYTTCPGPCLVLTQRMKAIADRLGPDLGTKAWFVSVTVDPEHDRPATLHAYAK